MSGTRRAERDRLLSIVRGFARARVVVLGDLVADEFVYGDIARVSREAPVLILDHDRTEVVLGGAANSVANLRALGARPVPVGVVGKDAAGHNLLDALRAVGVSTAKIVQRADYATPTKSRIMAGGVHTRRQQIVRIDRGARAGEVPPRVGARLDALLTRALAGARGLLVADYGYDAATPQRLHPRLARLVAGGLPVTVDSRARIAAFRGVSACTPNQEELENSAGFCLSDEAALTRAGKKLLRATGNESALVTRGAQGMVLFRNRRPAFHVPAYGSDEVADVTGAGDTVIAAFTLALIAGAAPEDATRLSNYAAGIVVTKAGTATVAPAELVAAIEEDLE